MNKEKLSWGLILLFVGGVLLLDNLDVIDFYWRSVFSMWPVILIIIGVNLLVPKRGMGNAVSIVVTIAALAFLAYRGTFPPRDSWWTFHSDDRRSERRERLYPDADGDDHARRLEKSKGTFTHEYDSNITEAHLSIKGGAVEYEIEGLTDKLFSAEATSTIGAHQLETTTNGSTAELTFSMLNNKKDNWDIDGDENRAEISLNGNPVWRIDLEMGAGAAEFDLTKYKVASLNFKGGAAAFEARLGMPLAETTINAESGVASVEIEIPRAAACRIVTKSGLSSRDFPGFTKQGDGSYVTEGFENASNKFVVNLQGGLSSFTVKRYD
ncbi:LiaI-LiaF-like domain-containing protein [Parapedobacter sp. DT-150]|uniref:LiaI-LiaF-like domain-containing protein n=1 Tax=Parapedobacter sp. DT-150 TaxID=3396162 RepID=UPI003F1CB437